MKPPFLALSGTVPARIQPIRQDLHWAGYGRFISAVLSTFTHLFLRVSTRGGSAAIKTQRIVPLLQDAIAPQAPIFRLKRYA